MHISNLYNNLYPISPEFCIVIFSKIEIKLQYQY